MTNEEIEKAKELAAHPKFEWPDGMLPVDAIAKLPNGCVDDPQLFRVVRLDGGKPFVLVGDDVTDLSETAYPNTSDRATKGILLGMIRELGGDHYHCRRTEDGKWVMATGEAPEFGWSQAYGPHCDTEGETLLRDLLSSLSQI